MSLKEEKQLSSSIFSSSCKNLQTHKTSFLSVPPSTVKWCLKEYILSSFGSTDFHLYSSPFLFACLFLGFFHFGLFFFFFYRGSQDKQFLFCVLFVAVGKVPSYPTSGYIWLHPFMEKKRIHKCSDERISHSALKKEAMKKYKVFFFFTTTTPTPPQQKAHQAQTA